LVRVGGGADDNRVGLSDGRTVGPKEPLQIPIQRREDSLFHEDALFERFPAVGSTEVTELGVVELAGVVRALDYVAVRVARVAVGAPELAADVRVQRPEVHAGLRGRVQHGARRERDESRAAEPGIEDRQVGRADWRYVGKQLQLPGSLR